MLSLELLVGVVLDMGGANGAGVWVGEEEDCEEEDCEEDVGDEDKVLEEEVPVDWAVLGLLYPDGVCVPYVTFPFASRYRGRKLSVDSPE